MNTLTNKPLFLSPPSMRRKTFKENKIQTKQKPKDFKVEVGPLMAIHSLIKSYTCLSKLATSQSTTTATTISYAYPILLSFSKDI